MGGIQKNCAQNDKRECEKKGVCSIKKGELIEQKRMMSEERGGHEREV